MLDIPLWQQRFGEDPFSQSLSVHTLDRYRREIRRLLEFLQRQGLSHLGGLTREHLKKYWLEVYASRSASGKACGIPSHLCRLGAVRGFVRFLVRNDYLLLDVSQGMAMPKQGVRLPRHILSEPEALQLLERPDHSTVLGLRDRAILELLYGAALRNSELGQLDLKDIDWPRHLLFVREGKGKKRRWVPMGEEAELWLEEYLQKSRPALAGPHSGERVFLSRLGCPLSRHGLALLVRRLARRAGLEKHITPHCLRHSCATHMLRRGAGMRQLQVLLGHDQLKSTQTYARVELSDLRKVVQRCHPREAR